ncbi:hypothetical protein [Vibrio sp. D431a]|uniref:hypothetical protein n=1 Tax=Vibrio sp. D431a TaxID=2837388 RepID=UPI002555A42C|nr:hypothetical protein [Vibrio sp. D431a]MDK9789783.1 hypothetical protein [Vibrio sp. D431a]
MYNSHNVSEEDMADELSKTKRWRDKLMGKSFFVALYNKRKKGRYIANESFEHAIKVIFSAAKDYHEKEVIEWTHSYDLRPCLRKSHNVTLDDGRKCVIVDLDFIHFRYQLKEVNSKSPEFYIDSESLEKTVLRNIDREVGALNTPSEYSYGLWRDLRRAK